MQLDVLQVPQVLWVLSCEPFEDGLLSVGGTFGDIEDEDGVEEGGCELVTTCAVHLEQMRRLLSPVVHVVARGWRRGEGKVVDLIVELLWKALQ